MGWSDDDRRGSRSHVRSSRKAALMPLSSLNRKKIPLDERAKGRTVTNRKNDAGQPRGRSLSQARLDDVRTCNVVPEPVRYLYWLYLRDLNNLASDTDQVLVEREVTRVM